ncbi:MAG: alpha/beta hydrolase [Hyphomicrobiaceae bacterium]
MARILRWSCGLGALAYLTVLLAMFAGQRSLLFATDDGGSLAAANWIAIPGSERVQLTTSDNERLSAWYVAPAPGNSVFLFFHGKGGKLQLKKSRWQHITKTGAGVLALSYRGYPGSTGSPSEAGLIRDAETAYAWLRQRHAAEEIVIHGLSLGTGVAVALAAQVDARALILEAPFSAAVDVAAERYPIVPVRWLMHDTFLSRERISKVNMPVLIAHGTRDTTIPFAHAGRLFAHAIEPKKFVAIQGGEHNTLVHDGLYPHIWNFLNQKY